MNNLDSLYGKELVFKGTFKKGTSAKGADYDYLELKLTDIYSKRVFLEESEKLLILMNNTNSNNNDIFPKF